VILIASTARSTAATSSFSDHMLQHLLLTMVAAPLLILGAPITWRCTPPDLGAGMPRVGAGQLRCACWGLIVTWSLFFLVIWGAHAEQPL
jgi:cytochrome c oxidase assembly factor CtaG